MKSTDNIIRNKLFLRPTNAFSGYNNEEVNEIKEWVINLEESNRKTKILSFPTLWNDIQGRWLLRLSNLLTF